VQPNASQSEIAGEYGEYLKVRLKAPAEDGKANKALIEFMAGHFKVRKKDVLILKGLTSRKKLIKINRPEES
jgi:uncharacterized protein (TIGR00251 family)